MKENERPCGNQTRLIVDLRNARKYIYRTTQCELRGFDDAW